ncbi:serine/threonine-protein kinase [Streptomyces sp. NPDC093261]|uniref:serine/threonine-protein kinase n=1 Tax=Streptomyces sp. NPDC093261 TaxID=3366037 RepID=UPI0037F709F9
MGEVFAGRYELVDPIGRGGVGAVWRAWDHRRRRYVAAKVLQQRDAHALLRFVREQALRIDHPHVLAPASWAADDDKVLFTMDLVAGGSLVHLVGDYGPLPPAFVCTLLDQLLSGLAAVHAEGVVHRDIKPANVLLEATGTARPRLRLSDFGIAMRLGEPRLTETDYVVGTPGYLAPEQLLGSEPDFPSDLFAVGLVALYLLQGAKPDARALVERFTTHGTPGAPRGVPAPLWEVVATLLQPDPAARFRTATGVRKALGSARELLPEPGDDDDQVEIFDQLGPLPAGFGPEGPLGRASGVTGGAGRGSGAALGPSGAAAGGAPTSGAGASGAGTSGAAWAASAGAGPRPSHGSPAMTEGGPAPLTTGAIPPRPTAAPAASGTPAPLPVAPPPPAASFSPSPSVPSPVSTPSGTPTPPPPPAGPHTPTPPPPGHGTGAPVAAPGPPPPAVRPQAAPSGVPPKPAADPTPPSRPSTMSDTGSFPLPPPLPRAARGAVPGAPGHPPTPPATAVAPAPAPAYTAPAPHHEPTHVPAPGPHTAAGQTTAYAAAVPSPYAPTRPQRVARHGRRAAARRAGPPAKVAVPVLLLALVCYAVGFWALARI